MEKPLVRNSDFLACPRCHGPLDLGGSHHCGSCDQTFPLQDVSTRGMVVLLAARKREVRGGPPGSGRTPAPERPASATKE